MQLTFDELDLADRQQLERDRQRLGGPAGRPGRGAGSGSSRRSARRYEGVRELVFPFAVAVCVAGTGQSGEPARDVAGRSAV